MVTRRKVTDGFGTFTEITFSGDDGDAFIEHLKDTAPEKRVERLEAYIARFPPSADPSIPMRREELRRRVTRAKARYDFALIELAEGAWRELEIYRVHMPRARQGAKQSIANRKNAQHSRGKIEVDHQRKITMKEVAKSFYVDDTPPEDLWPHFLSALEAKGLAMTHQTDKKGAKFFSYMNEQKEKTFKFHTFENYLSEEKTERRKRK